MAEPAITLNEEGAVREARRPFSSFFRRWLGGTLPESVQPAKTERQPDEQEEEFWDPRQGQPPTAAVQPMRPQAPRWKKDNPGLTDPLLDADDEDWIHQPYRSRSQAGTAGAHGSPENPNRIPAASTQQQQFSTLSIGKGPRPSYTLSSSPPVSTMESHPDRQEYLDAAVERLLRDKDFLLAEELKHKVDEINQLLVQAQRQKMKIELSVSELESRPGNKVSWMDVKIYKEI